MSRRDVDPRHLRDKYARWLGKKVVVGTTRLHYLCGRWLDLDGAEAVFSVGSERVRLGLAEIETVVPAADAQAEFVK